MFYTVTLNPNVDYFMEFSKPATLGTINRAARETLRPGGKGVNVSLMLKTLGEETVATGFLAGASGKFFENLLQENACPQKFFFLPNGQTRINVKLPQEPETAFNGAGPALNEAGFVQLLDWLDRLTPADTLVLSGKLPEGIPEAYLLLAKKAISKGARFAADTEGAALAGLLPLSPFLIKPNRFELAELYDLEQAPTLDDVISLAKKAQTDGARNVLVSMDASGAYLAAADGKGYLASLNRAYPVASTVGAGDSLLAGFLAGISQGKSMADALRFAVSCGTATACCDWLASAEQVSATEPDIQVEILEE